MRHLAAMHARWRRLRESIRIEHVAIVLAGLVGVGLRLDLMLRSLGSNDILTWQHWGEFVDAHGVRYCYEKVQGFNHPPLMGYLAAAILHLAHALHLRFEVLFKLVPLAGDVLTGVLLVRLRHGDLRSAALAVGLYALSLVSIVITGYHGNTDPLCAALVLAAALQFDAERPFTAGAIMALALNVKLIPAPVAIALALQCRSWRQLARFVGGTALGALPFLPFVAAVPWAFYNAAIAYNSSDNLWGSYAFFMLAHQTFRLSAKLGWGLDLVWRDGRYFILGGQLVVAVVSRLKRRSAVEVSLAILAAFLVLTPGFGVQYLVYVVPVMFALNPSRAAVYSTVSGVFLSLIYYDFWTGQVPYYSLFNRHFPLCAVWIGAIVWAQLAAILFDVTWNGARNPSR